ncbi:MAG: hypothetical protein CME31_10625 [Gimesia sp.]|nr:hypothetical protein [Gimesia sp.]
MVGQTSGATANTIRSTGDVVAYYSDERLKTVEGKIENALELIDKINGYYFHENETAKELGYDNDRRQVGVLAQEIETILPEVIEDAAVNADNNTDYKTVQYGRIIPLLINAIKELKTEIETLKNR